MDGRNTESRPETSENTNKISVILFCVKASICIIVVFLIVISILIPEILKRDKIISDKGRTTTATLLWPKGDMGEKVQN
jgi:hypothetical protein